MARSVSPLITFSCSFLAPMALTLLGSCTNDHGPFDLVAEYTHPKLGFSVRLPRGWTTKTDPSDKFALNALSNEMKSALNVRAVEIPKGHELRPGTDAWRSYKETLGQVSLQMKGGEMVTIEESQSSGHPALFFVAKSTDEITGNRQITLTLNVVATEMLYVISVSTDERNWAVLSPVFRRIAASFRTAAPAR